jgi:hypothetical protein
MCGAEFQDFRMNLIRSFALLLVSAVVATPALAQDRRVPSSGAELRLSYAPIVQRAQPGRWTKLRRFIAVSWTIFQ